MLVNSSCYDKNKFKKLYHLYIKKKSVLIGLYPVYVVFYMNACKQTHRKNPLNYFFFKSRMPGSFYVIETAIYLRDKCLRC